MFNKQLRRNIGQLDSQIGELSKEINGIRKDTKYEVKMRTLEDLTELRSKLAKSLKDGESSLAIVELDRQIEELLAIISRVETDEVYVSKLKKLEDLTKVRAQLADVRSKESHTSVIISGAVSIAATLLVLKHEKTDVITSKAYSIATSLFRRGK